MSSQNKAISAARLHFPLFVPGLGNVKATELSLDTKDFIHPTKMTMMDGYVECEMANREGKTAVVLVPLSNFINLVVKKEALAKDNKA